MDYDETRLALVLMVDQANAHLHGHMDAGEFLPSNPKYSINPVIQSAYLFSYHNAQNLLAAERETYPRAV